MIPSADRIMARRHTVVIVLRFVSGVLLLIGGARLIYVVVGALLWSGLGFLPRDPEALRHVAFSVACLIPATILLVLQNKIARWLVPIPRSECPRCGYSLAHLREGRCPECGLVVTAASSGDEPADPGSS